VKRFSTYIPLTESKNTHMTHIEDLIIDGGVKGARQAILALRSLRDMLSGNTKAPVDVTVKWDGAPAVFAGEDPETGEFFVAKKGIFAKNPKIYKSHADIDADTSGDLSKKLKLAFDSLKGVGIKGVIQGDFMFDKSDLKKEKINGVSHITFHPNTIVYAIPTDNAMAKEISSAKVGIVWHTSYSGATFETMRAEFGREIVPKLKRTKDVWMVDATLPDLSGTATLTSAETKELNSNLSNAGKIFKKIQSGVLKEIEKNKELNLVINIYNNRVVREGQRITDTKKHATGLVMFVNDRYAKEIDKRKSQKGKDVQITKRDELLSFFSKNNIKNLKNIFDLQNFVVDAKLILINKLNKLSSIGTFVKTKSGFRVTNPEGFVAIDRMEGGAVKLVDRLEFSTNNFSKDIIKGWDNPS
tara:strand:- start:1951 stop:3192 length:1242 start_codon:yes stop_codon:yes gene_type:complete